MPTYEPNYVVGRGRLFFNLFRKGSNTPVGGEMYFGNTPEFTLTADTETLDHYSSEEGMRNLDASVLLEYTQGGNFTTDEVNGDNLALFFLGEKSSITQLQETGRKEVLGTLQKARYYQLGTDDMTPTGVRNVDNFQIVVADPGTSISLGTGDITTIPGATVLAAKNFEIDLEKGRLYIEPDADIAPGTPAAVQYDVSAQARDTVIGKANMIYGSLRFVSDNPVGQQKDYFFPKVALQPDGDYALKGDDWQVMSFTFRAMKLNSTKERVYIDIRDAAAPVDPTTIRHITVTAPATGTVGTALTVNAFVRDGNNNPVQGDAVTFTVAGTATAAPTSGSSDSTGKVSTQLTASAAGSVTVTAKLANGASAQTQPITISA